MHLAHALRLDPARSRQRPLSYTLTTAATESKGSGVGIVLSGSEVRLEPLSLAQPPVTCYHSYKLLPCPLQRFHPQRNQGRFNDVLA